jgi:hypothetical protein
VRCSAALALVPVLVFRQEAGGAEPPRSTVELLVILFVVCAVPSPDRRRASPAARADAGALAVQDPFASPRGVPGEGPYARPCSGSSSTGLDGAACELGTTREELVWLAPRPQPGVEIRWDDETIEEAVRAGPVEAISDAEERGSVNALVAVVLREVAERAPVQWKATSSTGGRQACWIRGSVIRTSDPGRRDWQRMRARAAGAAALPPPPPAREPAAASWLD